MAVLLEIRSACAKVWLPNGEWVGVAFLVSGSYALTAAHLFIDHRGNIRSGIETVELEFPSGRYRAKMESFNRDIDCAVLLLEKPVEDVTPLVLGVDVALGDVGYFYGFLDALEGVGVFFDGQVQDITPPKETTMTPFIILFPSRSFSQELFVGFSGSPLVVGNLVVGILTARYQGTSRISDFLIFARIQDTLELLPKEIAQRIRPSPVPKVVGEKIGEPEIVVITALDEELDYLFDLPLDWSELKIQKDGISYRRGHFTKNVDIIATSARSMGLVATSILTAKALKEWSPSVAAMIGICGGRKEKGLNIGDIVVANQGFHYQFGAFEDGKIIRELRVENIEMQIIDIAEHLSRRTTILSELQQSLPRGFKKPNTLLQCHVGPMASADLVVKDVEKFGEAIEADRKTIAIDMESYAFMRASRLANMRWSFVVKSVSDFADDKKDDEYREYAKYTSAKFFIQIAQSLIAGWS